MQGADRGDRAAETIDGRGLSIGLVQARFNGLFTDRLAAACRAELLRLHEANEVHDTVLHVLEEELDLEEMSARRFEGEEQLGSDAAIR